VRRLANIRQLRRVDCHRRERGVRDRYGRAVRIGRSFNLSIELVRERLDDAGAESDSHQCRYANGVLPR
jgi:hypothetical protein